MRIVITFMLGDLAPFPAGAAMSATVTKDTSRTSRCLGEGGKFTEDVRYTPEHLKVLWS